MICLPLLTAIVAATCVQAAYLPFPDLSYIFNNIGVPDFDDGWSDKSQPAQSLSDYFPETSLGGSIDNPWAAGSGGRDYRAMDQPYGDEWQYPSNPVFSDEYDNSQGGLRYPIDIPPYDESPKYPVQKSPLPAVPYQSPDVPAYGVNGRKDGRQSGVSSPQFPDYPVAKYPEEKHPSVDLVPSDIFDDVGNGLPFGGSGSIAGYHPGVKAKPFDSVKNIYDSFGDDVSGHQSAGLSGYQDRPKVPSGSQYPDSPVAKHPEEKRYPIDSVASELDDFVGGKLLKGGSDSSTGYLPGVIAKPFDSGKNIYDNFGDDVSGHQSADSSGYQERPGVLSQQFSDYPVAKFSGENRYPVEPRVSEPYVGGRRPIGGSGSSTGYFPDVQANNAPKHTYPVDVYNYRESLKCQPEFFFQYDHDFSGPVWQDVKGEVQVQNGRAVFNGRGSIAVPFFACNDLLPRYSMSFVIRPSNVGGTHAVIGNSLYPDKASLLVSVTGSSLRLTVRERAADLKPEQLLAGCWDRKKRSLDSLPDFGAGFGTSSPKYTNVIALELPIYSGSETLVTITQEDDWIFFGVGNQRIAKRGRLPTLTNEPLYVGTGADPMGHTTLPDYVGTFDSFLFEKCPKSQ